MTIELSVAIIAIALVIIAAFAIVAVIALCKTLTQVDLTLVDARKKMDELTINATKTTDDLNCKMTTLQPIFNALGNVGDLIEQRSKRMKIKAELLAMKNLADHEEEEDAEPQFKGVKISQIVDMFGIGVKLWQNLNRRS